MREAHGQLLDIVSKSLAGLLGPIVRKQVELKAESQKLLHNKQQTHTKDSIWLHQLMNERTAAVRGLTNADSSSRGAAPSIARCPGKARSSFND